MLLFDRALRLRDPFGGADVRWNRADLKREGDDYLVEMEAGQVLEGRLKP